MKKIFAAVFIACILLTSSLSSASLLKKAGNIRAQKRGGELDSDTIAKGLKEALSLGARNGVRFVSKRDGYFGNRLIKIPMPEKMKKMERMIRKAGFRKEADDFILSMNRAAEKAAPQALEFFIDAVKKMTISDARGILHGKDTAATDFLKSRTYDRIYTAFKPVVKSAMNDVKVTRSFKQFMGKANSIPFLKKEKVDLDRYVTEKALEGLFAVVAQEEGKIRKDPKARATDLLRKVFK